MNEGKIERYFELSELHSMTVDKLRYTEGTLALIDLEHQLRVIEQQLRELEAALFDSWDALDVSKTIDFSCERQQLHLEIFCCESAIKDPDCEPEHLEQYKHELRTDRLKLQVQLMFTPQCIDCPGCHVGRRIETADEDVA